MPLVDFNPPCPKCEVKDSVEVYAWFAQLVGEPGTIESDDDGYIDAFAGDAAEHHLRYHRNLGS